MCKRSHRYVAAAQPTTVNSAWLRHRRQSRTLTAASEMDDDEAEAHQHTHFRHSIVLSGGVRRCWRQEDFCDVVVTAEAEDGKVQSFRAHRIVLAAFSPALRYKFTHGDEADGAGVVRVRAEPAIMRRVLDYMYTGRLVFAEVQRERIVKVMQKLRISLAETLVANTVPDCHRCEDDQREVNRLKLEPVSDFEDDDDDDEEEEEEIPLMSSWESSLLPVKAELAEYDGGGEDSWNEEPLATQPELILEEDDEGLSDEVVQSAKCRTYSAAMKDEAPATSVLLRDEHPRLDSGLVLDPFMSERDHANNKKYLCSLCGRTLTGLTAYNRHQVIHTGARPFECEICGKSFTQNQRLTVHKRAHTGERPYLCSLCGVTFTESCKLKRHLSRVHKANKDGSELIPGQPVINVGRNAPIIGMQKGLRERSQRPSASRSQDSARSRKSKRKKALSRKSVSSRRKRPAASTSATAASEGATTQVLISQQCSLNESISYAQ